MKDKHHVAQQMLDEQQEKKDNGPNSMADN